MVIETRVQAFIKKFTTIISCFLFFSSRNVYLACLILNEGGGGREKKFAFEIVRGGSSSKLE